jgi:hypothetical protein
MGLIQREKVGVEKGGKGRREEGWPHVLVFGWKKKVFGNWGERKKKDNTRLPLTRFSILPLSLPISLSLSLLPHATGPPLRSHSHFPKPDLF